MGRTAATGDDGKAAKNSEDAASGPTVDTGDTEAENSGEVVSSPRQAESEVVAEDDKATDACQEEPSHPAVSTAAPAESTAADKCESGPDSQQVEEAAADDPTASAISA